jgi:hypothetical protein
MPWFIEEDPSDALSTAPIEAPSISLLKAPQKDL